MGTIEIEDNVPLPKRYATTRGMPLHRMAVGQSIFLPEDQCKGTKGIGTRQRIYKFAQRYNEAHGLTGEAKVRFKTHWGRDPDKGLGLRVWRMK